MRGEEQGSKSPFSLLFEPISPSALLFISSSRSTQFNSPYSQPFFSLSSLLSPPIFPSSQLFLDHFSLLPILFLSPLQSRSKMLNASFLQRSEIAVKNRHKLPTSIQKWSMIRSFVAKLIPRQHDVRKQNNN